MSGGHSAPHGSLGPWSILGRLFVLGLVLAGMYLGTAFSQDPHGSAGDVAALGFLLLAGDLSGQLVGVIGIPHLTGYLLAGVVAGPQVLHLVSHQAVMDLQEVNGLALSLIAMTAGAELSLDLLRKGLRSIVYGTLSQTFAVFGLVAVAFALASPLIPFLHGRPLSLVAGASLLWAVVAIVKSPSAVLGLLSETKAKGPLSTYAIAMVVILDVVVLVLFAVVMAVSGTLIDGSPMTLAQFHELGRELLASAAVGTTFGLAIAVYLRFVRQGAIVFLVVLTYAASALSGTLGYDAMLAFIVAGFVVENLSGQGEKLRLTVAQSGRVIFVVFFANAGAHLDILTLAQLWPVALLLCGARAVATAVAAYTASAWARDPPAVRQYGWAPLISQAGVALGIALKVDQIFPALGDGFLSLAIAVVGLNEAIGPVLFKIALSRAGELPKAVILRPEAAAAIPGS
jgi:Kef-type K+ transport system membrane component KefB